VAVIGCGTIGASWAACFLAQGLDVAAHDPAPGAEARLRAFIDRAWPTLAALGLAPAADRARLRVHSSAAAAAEGADLVQESVLERLEVKHALFAAIEPALDARAMVASSSSTFTPSAMQQGMRHPERLLLAHPFNPPHLIPLVEVVGGRDTDEAAIARTVAFLHGIGKKPIRLRREIRGHIANRLQAALWQEAFALVEEGVASVADIDTAIAHGPGLRWALLGPFLNLHLSGGAGGLAHVLAHLGPPTEAMWRDLRPVHLSPALAARVVAGVQAELAAGDEGAMVEARDEVLQQLLRLKAAHPHLP
jgi:3-hydroxyacyl-CoA dehydrogenase